MDNPIVIAIIVTGVVFLVFMLTNRSDDDEKDDEKKEKKIREYPYILNESFLSPAELSFFRTLQQVIGKQAVIAVKVRIGDVFRIKPKQSKFHTYRNMINRKHVDFLLCHPETMQPIMAIELDDKSHQRKDRQERDKFVDKVFQAAGLPLLHLPVKRGYVLAEIAEQIAPYVGLPASAPSVSPREEGKDEKNCPKCGSKMILRTAKKGPNAGLQFWGCMQYPNCKARIKYTK